MGCPANGASSMGCPSIWDVRGNVPVARCNRATNNNDCNSRVTSPDPREKRSEEFRLQTDTLPNGLRRLVGCPSAPSLDIISPREDGGAHCLGIGLVPVPSPRRDICLPISPVRGGPSVFRYEPEEGHLSSDITSPEEGGHSVFRYHQSI